MFKNNHPAMCEPPSLGEIDGVFEPYPSVPCQPPILVSGDVVESVASKLSGSAGPGGTDREELKNCLLRYGTHSHMLREELASLTNWLANDHSPWAAYRALMTCRLVALDKQPGVRPVGDGHWSPQCRSDSHRLKSRLLT